MKKQIISFFSVLSLMCCLLFGCGNNNLGKGALEPTSGHSADEAFETLSHQWFASQMAEDPLSCHFSVANPSAYGISFSRESFSDLSYHSFQAAQKDKRAFLKELKQISYQQLSPRNQLVYDLLQDYYTLQESFNDFYYYADPLSPTSGVPATLPTLLSAYSFHNKEDISLYFHLLDDVDIYFEQLLCFAQEKSEKGLLQNKEGFHETISFCKDFSEPRSNHMLLVSFQERIQSCDFLSHQEKQKYINKNHAVICDVVLPSYLSLSKDLLSLSINDDLGLSLCQVPKGHKYYASVVKASTGCNTSPFQLFQEIETKRNADVRKMSKLLAAHPSLASSIANYQCPLTNPEEMMEILRQSIDKDFPSFPNVTVAIHPVSKEIAPYSAPAYYLIAPIDAYDSHDVYYNAKSFPNTLDLFTTMAHEGFPGHLYQTCMSYNYGYEPVRCLLSYPGYVEGWATYVEMQSYQYAGLPAQVAQILSLNQSVVLSLYASADIGIHYYGWDEDILLDFLSEYGIHDKEVVSEIYHIIGNDPANYLKYYVGYMNFEDLRNECEKMYPDTFSPMDFHKCILQTGPSSFSILRRELLNYFGKSA